MGITAPTGKSVNNLVQIQFQRLLNSQMKFNCQFGFPRRIIYWVTQKKKSQRAKNVQGSKQGFDGHAQINDIVTLNYFVNENTAQKNEGARGGSVKKNPSTVWRANCTTISRKFRADLVDKRGCVLVCDLVALMRVTRRIGPDTSRDVKNCVLQSEQAQKSRRQSNCLLRRERECKLGDSVREQRQVTRLLEAVVSSSCGVHSSGNR